MTPSGSSQLTGLGAGSGRLRVGAVKVDITSPENALPPGYKAMFEKGCAVKAIVNTILDMMDQSMLE